MAKVRECRCQVARIELHYEGRTYCQCGYPIPPSAFTFREIPRAEYRPAPVVTYYMTSPGWVLYGLIHTGLLAGCIAAGITLLVLSQ